MKKNNYPGKKQINLLMCCCTIAIAAATVSINAKAQTTVNINPVNATYGTGTIGGDANHNKYSGDLQLLAGGGLGTGNYGNGWMRFDVSSLPSNAVITSVKVFYHALPASGGTYIKGYSTTTGASNDPLVATGANLYNLCNAISGSWVAIPAMSGSQVVDLGATAVTYLQSSFLATPLFVVAFGTSASSITMTTLISGYNNSTAADRPYLIITYTISSTAINYNSQPGEMNFYPNPVKDKFTIYNLPFTVNKIDVFDMLAKKIMSENFNNREMALDISTLKKGIYFLSVETGNGKLVRKIVKE